VDCVSPSLSSSDTISPLWVLVSVVACRIFRLCACFPRWRVSLSFVARFLLLSDLVVRFGEPRAVRASSLFGSVFVGVESRCLWWHGVPGRIESNESTQSPGISVVPRATHSYAVSHHTKTNNQPDIGRTTEKDPQGLAAQAIPQSGIAVLTYVDNHQAKQNTSSVSVNNNTRVQDARLVCPTDLILILEHSRIRSNGPTKSLHHRRQPRRGDSNVSIEQRFRVSSRSQTLPALLFDDMA
jgi:hypothetical protein